MCQGNGGQIETSEAVILRGHKYGAEGGFALFKLAAETSGHSGSLYRG